MSSLNTQISLPPTDLFYFDQSRGGQELRGLPPWQTDWEIQITENSEKILNDATSSVSN